MNNELVHVTQPFLPPLDEFVPYLEQIWQSRVLTNSGAMHRQLEQSLAEYLGVKHVCLFNNGTNALLTALQALDLTGEVITTPYSFAATTHALVWNRLTPVFVDIDPVTLNLDPARVEAAVTDRTTAILPVHCYGNSCDVAAIEALARTRGLKVLYDAAHAFGVRDEGGSLLRHGDLSVVSFHATKVFNTFEGGAIICHDEAMKQRIDQLKNFGIASETQVVEVGINGKMSEINAAFGLLQLQYIDAALAARREIDRIYREQLSDMPDIQPVAGAVYGNCGYFPVLLKPEYPLSRDQLYQKMKDSGVLARRYFYPLISEFPMYRDMASACSTNLPVATRVAKEVLCLPIHPGLSQAQQQQVIDLVRI